MMLELALKARLPLISVTTRDTIHAVKVIKYLSQDHGREVEALTNNAPSAENTVYVRVADRSTSGRTLEAGYEHFSKNGSTLVYLNLPDPPESFFQAGELPVPPDLVQGVLVQAFVAGEPGSEQWKVNKRKAQPYLDTLHAALGGMTIREVKELIRMAQAHVEVVTPATMTLLRNKMFAPIDGLLPVSSTLGVYKPDPQWEQFVEHEKLFFLSPIDERLRVRGSLLDGPPGTGKTQGAKYLANKWGVPLYRMEASMNSKWHGESERNMRRVLEQCSHEAPCVLLIDEAEKLLGIKHSSDVGRKMMSLLLWWMQENDKPVMVLMTTNKKEDLPPELLRPGRIDRQFEFKGLKGDQAKELGFAVIETFKDVISEEARTKIGQEFWKKYAGDDKVHIQADVVQHAYDLVKKKLAEVELAKTEAA